MAAIAFPTSLRMLADESPRETEMIASPCVKICTLDVHSGLCLGCSRSIDEIAKWATLGSAERERILAELPWRLAASRHTETTREIG